MSLDLPLRLAVGDQNGQPLLIHQTSEDYRRDYRVDEHPVLERVEALVPAPPSEPDAWETVL